MMKFQSESDESSDLGRTKPPPNYHQRSVQLKLMMLVGSLMLVLVMMNEARKPETWEFMGFTSQADEENSDDQPIDTRVYLDPDGDGSTTPIDQDGDNQDGSIDRDADSRGDQDNDGDPDGDDPDGDDPDVDDPDVDDPNIADQIRQPRDSNATGSDDSGQALDDDASDRSASNLDDDSLLWKTRRDFWSMIYWVLTPEWQELIFVGLREGRTGGKLDEELHADWREMVMQLGQEREAYHHKMLRAISMLPDQDLEKSQLWTDVLLQMQQHWRDLVPALSQVPDGTDRNLAPVLVDLQLVLDEIVLSSLEDDHLGSRAVEKEAWYRQFERLASARGDGGIAPSNSADAESTFETTSFVQMFEQPDAYRGRPVHIRGEVKIVEYRRASPNRYGIDGYHVFWVRPEGKSNLPILVYALELPAGFPPYDENGRLEFARGKLEPVKIDGIFFRRWAYEAQDGLRICPLVVTLRPTWEPRAEETPGTTLPSLPVALMWIFAIGLFAVVIARFAHRASAQKRPPGFKMPGSQPDELAPELRDQLAKSDRGLKIFENGEPPQ